MFGGGRNGKNFDRIHSLFISFSLHSSRENNVEQVILVMMSSPIELRAFPFLVQTRM